MVGIMSSLSQLEQVFGDLWLACQVGGSELIVIEEMGIIGTWDILQKVGIVSCICG